MILRTVHGDIPLPAFLPDATRGCIRGLASADVAAARVDALVVNAYHLMLKPGARLIQSLGGIHEFMQWDRPVLVDSGGFQVFSLIRERPNMGTIRADEVIFHSPYDGEKTILSPEKCIQVQHHLGADIMMCLDDCTRAEESAAEQAAAVERTIRWARLCRESFNNLNFVQRKRFQEPFSVGAHNNPNNVQRKRFQEPFLGDFLPQEPMGCREEDEHPTANIQHSTPNDAGPGPSAVRESRNSKPETRIPLLFGIIQGGTDRDLRRKCAEALIEIGFDGYALGGWPVDAQGRLLEDMLAAVAELMPADKPRYAMGIGKPENVVACARMGYNLFDCVIPTRDARHHHAFAFNASSFEGIDLTGPGFYTRVNFGSGRYARDKAPISSFCDCATCRSYSRAYIRHLFEIKDSLAGRLASIHNLRFYTMLMERLRSEVRGLRSEV